MIHKLVYHDDTFPLDSAVVVIRVREPSFPTRMKFFSPIRKESQIGKLFLITTAEMDKLQHTRPDVIQRGFSKEDIVNGRAFLSAHIKHHHAWKETRAYTFSGRSIYDTALTMVCDECRPNTTYYLVVGLTSLHTPSHKYFVVPHFKMRFSETTKYTGHSPKMLVKTAHHQHPLPRDEMEQDHRWSKIMAKLFPIFLHARRRREEESLVSYLKSLREIHEQMEFSRDYAQMLNNKIPTSPVAVPESQSQIRSSGSSQHYIDVDLHALIINDKDETPFAETGSGESFASSTAAVNGNEIGQRPSLPESLGDGINPAEGEVQVVNPSESSPFSQSDRSAVSDAGDVQSRGDSHEEQQPSPADNPLNSNMPETHKSVSEHHSGDQINRATSYKPAASDVEGSESHDDTRSLTSESAADSLLGDARPISLFSRFSKYLKNSSPYKKKRIRNGGHYYKIRDFDPNSVGAKCSQCYYGFDKGSKAITLKSGRTNERVYGHLFHEDCAKQKLKENLHCPACALEGN